MFQSFRLEVKNPGGHSSLPVPDNAIYRLAEGLVRFSRFRFPVRLNEVTRLFFERSAATVPEPEASDRRAVARNPPDPAAAERLSAQPDGARHDQLPDAPGRQARGRRGGDRHRARRREDRGHPRAGGKPSPPSPLTAGILAPIERVSSTMWPGVPVVPIMSSGATDSLYLRAAGIPVYGVDGIFEDVDDVRAHGRDERTLAASFYEGQEFLCRLVQALSSPEAAR